MYSMYNRHTTKHLFCGFCSTLCTEMNLWSNVHRRIRRNTMKIAMWTTYSIKLSCAAVDVVYVLQSLHECVIFDDKDAVLCNRMRLSIHVKYPSRKWKRWNYSQAFLLHHVKISSHLLWEFEPVSTWWYTHTHSYIYDCMKTNFMAALKWFNPVQVSGEF